MGRAPADGRVPAAPVDARGIASDARGHAAESPGTTSPLAATATPLARVVSPPPASKARPPAPQVSFSKRRDAEQSDVALPLEQTTTASESVTCALCGTSNQRGLRFCITCGQLLGHLDEGGADHVGAIELLRTAVDTAPVDPSAGPAGIAPIAPARVIDVGRMPEGTGRHENVGRMPEGTGRHENVAPSTPRAEPRLCPRCRGAYEAGAQFCRFCGYSLAGPAASAAPPVSVDMPGSQGPPVTARGVSPPAQVSLTRARLVLIARDGTEGANFALTTANDLGRLEGQILFPDDPYVSPRHARIVAHGGALFLRDLESTNGVFMRIPYRTASDEEWASDAEDKVTIRGHQGHHSGSARELSADQPLGDQELFLVGQQVLRFDVVKEAEESFGPASENGTLLFGTPAAPRYARLSQRTTEGVVRDVFHLRRAETVIGRESGDIVFTDDPFLSRRHAVLRMHAAGGQKRRFTLTDLGSSNGTFLRIKEEVRLRHGDHFRIGQQLLRFDIDAAHAGE
jgi:pSer/pThr/pTyr-binding forkhead associated (FHA) protein